MPWSHVAVGPCPISLPPPMFPFLSLLFTLLFSSSAYITHVHCSRPIFPVAVLCTIPSIEHAINPSYNGVYDVPCQERLDAYNISQQHINENGTTLDDSHYIHTHPITPSHHHTITREEDWMLFR